MPGLGPRRNITRGIFLGSRGGYDISEIELSLSLELDDSELFTSTEPRACSATRTPDLPFMFSLPSRVAVVVDLLAVGEVAGLAPVGFLRSRKVIDVGGSGTVLRDDDGVMS